MRSFGSQRLAAWLWIVRRRLARNRYERLKRKVTPDSPPWAGVVDEPRRCVLCGVWYSVRRDASRVPERFVRVTGLCSQCAQERAHPLYRAFLRQVLLDEDIAED